MHLLHCHSNYRSVVSAGSIAAGEVPRQTPWFEKYRQEYLRLLGFSDLETYDHPVACAHKPFGPSTA